MSGIGATEIIEVVNDLNKYEDEIRYKSENIRFNKDEVLFIKEMIRNEIIHIMTNYHNSWW